MRVLAVASALLAVALAGCSACRDGDCARPPADFTQFADASFARQEDVPLRLVDVVVRPRCPENLATCPPDCVDLATDPQHCGQCRRACSPNFTCTEGRCTCPTPGFTLCGTACAALSTDVQHCGRCGLECAAGSRCVGGRCQMRPVEPRMGSTLGSRRPRFRWSGGAGRVQVCRDAACAEVVAALEGFAGRATATEALAPGRYFWRLGDAAGVRWEAAWAFRIDRRDTMAQGALPPRPDVDGDGLHDVVVTQDGGRVRVFTRGLASTEAAWSFATATADGAMRPVSAGDLDGDGSGELLVQGMGNGWLARGADRGASLVSVNFFARGAVAVAGDTDLDGRTEVGWLLAGRGLYVFREGETLDAWTETRRFEDTTAGSSLLAPGDVDGDGVGDLVAAAQGSRVLVYQGSAEGFAAGRGVLVDDGLRGGVDAIEAGGDLNGDGLSDVIVHTTTTTRALMGGAPAFAGSVALPSQEAGALRAAPAGDVNGDGFSDLLAIAPMRGEVRLFLGGAMGLSTTPTVVALAAAADAETSAVALGDVDGDEADDVALASPTRALVHVIFGGAARPLTRVVTLRGEPGSRFGAAVE